MTFAELKTELVSRGASNDDTRNGLWINSAYRQILNAFDWPFTEATATGTVGAGTVVVADLRKVQFVGDISVGSTPGNPLDKITIAELQEDVLASDFALTGTAFYWYWDGPTTTIKTYPIGGTVYTRYQKRIDPLTGVNAPIFDEEYHLLIVDRAMVEVYKDAEDTQQAKDALALFTIQLGQMAQDYQIYSRAHSYIQAGFPYDG